MSVLKEIIQKTKDNLPALTSINKRDIEKTSKNFKTALDRQPAEPLPRLIAELKRKSPSAGDLKPQLSVSEAVELYKNHASAMSILTEPFYFNGSLDDLLEASKITTIPLLRKDFIIDPVQILQARQNGGDAYLLIVAALSPAQLNELIEAGREWNMPALVEVHNEDELETALCSAAEIIGINNRNLNNLEIDLKQTPKLLSMIPNDKRKQLTLVAESGYSKYSELAALPAEVNAVLMGTTFMSHDNPAAKLAEIFNQQGN